MTTITHRSTDRTHNRYASLAAAEAANFQMQYFTPDQADAIRKVEDDMIAKLAPRPTRTNAPRGASFTFEAHNALREKGQVFRSKIADLLDTPKSAQDIAEQLGQTAENVRAQMKKAEALGLLDRVEGIKCRFRRTYFVRAAQ